MKTIGFMFGAGAEISYGLPSGGDFALNIFRHDSSESKKAFKEQRDRIDATSRYAQWLPVDYKTKNISVFTRKAYEDIIRSTVEQNRENIIKRLNKLDKIAEQIITDLKLKNIDVDSAFLDVNQRSVSDTFMNQTIQFVQEFNDGNDIFRSNYFSAMLMAYKQTRSVHSPENGELSKIILAILQLQIGALGEKLSRKINDGVFEKKDDDIDILDDIGDIILLNYQSVGMAGLEYLLEIREPDTSKSIGIILCFAQILIEKIYSCVLDYKSLIDSNWMYLYHPLGEWGKFCKIAIFLLNTQSYIRQLYDRKPFGKTGYYDEIKEAVSTSKFSISTVGTSNYSPLVEEILGFDKVVYLNGSITLLYDPYLNRIDSADGFADAEQHFLVPLMFTQSGTKPMISIDMSSKYVSYYSALSASDEICVIGFAFNNDDEHINGLFRDLVDRKGKSLTIVELDRGESPEAVKKRTAQQLKIKSDNRLSVILVNESRKRNGVSWIDCLISSVEGQET